MSIYLKKEMRKKIGRNNLCHCGSGKKYTKCCAPNECIDETNLQNLDWQHLSYVNDQLTYKIFEYFQQKCSGVIGFAWNEYHAFETNLEVSQISHDIIYNFADWAIYKWRPTGKYHEFDVNCTIAVQYLAKQRYKLSTIEKQLIDQNMQSNYSYYEIISVSPGESVKVKDILRNRVFEINEADRTEIMLAGYVLMAKIITINNVKIFTAIYPRMLSERFVKDASLLKKNFVINGDFTDDNLDEVELEIRELFLEKCAIEEKSVMNHLKNTYGEDFIPTKLIYWLNCSIEDAFKQLSVLNIKKHPQEILEDAIYDDHAQLSEVNFAWQVAKDNEINKSCDDTVFAYITLFQHALVVETHSLERADQAKKNLDKLMGNLIEYQTRLSSQVDEEQLTLDIIPAEFTTLLKKFHDSYILDWLETSLDDLAGKTPKKAAKTKQGRELLEILFVKRHQQNLSIQKQGIEFEEPQIDLEFVRSELGLK